jgi:CRISPR type III-B/RAMP module RAMP protein Cmr6
MIPMSPDVRRLVGDWADQVDNRSLLHEKFALPKVWGHPKKTDQAGRWSILRIVQRGEALLEKDSGDLKDDAEKRRRKANKETDPQKRDEQLERAAESERLAKVADGMAKSAKNLTEAFKDHRRLKPLLEANLNRTLRFLADLDKSFSGRVATFEATLGARLLVNLAGGVIENAGIALDRCFGLPFIPGSAVKGIARSQALWEIHDAQGPDKERLLRLAMLLFGYGANDIKSKGDFGWAGSAAAASRIADEIGNQDYKGCACFLPAYPTTPPVLVVDMVNPHYPDYYRGLRANAEDNESPIPNYFPAVEAGSSFGFAVLLNRIPKGDGVTASDLLNQARQWLERAVTRKGVGAKTAAGYGWFELGRKTAPSTQPAPEGASSPPATIAAPTPPSSPADAFIDKWRGKLTTTGNFAVALPELLALADDAELKRAFEAVIPENERRRLRKNHPYWQSFTSGRHGEAGKKILTRLGLKLT